MPRNKDKPSRDPLKWSREEKLRLLQKIEAEEAAEKCKDLEAQGCEAWYTAVFGVDSGLTTPLIWSELAPHHREALEWHWMSMMLRRVGQDITKFAYFAIWPRGHMKCVNGDTEVLMGDGARKAIKDVHAGDLVQSWDEVTGKMVRGKVTAQWQAGLKGCVRVKTRAGWELTATPDHKVRTFAGWKKIGDLLSTDRIASPRRIKAAAADYPISDEELRLLTYFLAEGSTTDGAANITNADDVIVADSIVCAESLGFSGNRSVSAKYRVNFQNGIRAWLQRWGIAGKKSTEKRWPSELNQLSVRQLQVVLAAWLDTDGFISTQSAGINLANERLIDDLRYLCLQAGIVTKKYYLPREGFGSWVLEFDHHNIGRLASLPLRLKQANWSNLLSVSRYSLVDTYPREIALGLPKGENRRLRREIGWKPGSKTPRITRDKIQRAAAVSSNPQWEWLEQAEVFWDEVVQIEDAGQCETYDLEVKGTHNFIAAGLVTHNSTLARYIAVCDAAISGVGYCLYVSGTKNKVRGHAISVETLLHSPKMKEYYPGLSIVKRNEAGGSKGWQADFIYTDCGYVFHFISLDEGVAGANIDNTRVTLAVLDDIDDREESPLISENRLRTLTKGVLPTRQKGTLVFWAQNFISRYSVLYQVYTGKARFLTSRVNTKPIPGFLNFKTEEKTIDGIIHDVIVSGEPTWAWYGVDRAQEEIDTIGLEAFMSEVQHDVEQDRSGLILPEYDDHTHPVAWPDFNALYGLDSDNRDVPQHWRRFVGFDWGSSGAEAGHACVVLFFAVAAANGPLPGTVFLYKSMTFPASVIAGAVAHQILNFVLGDLQAEPRTYIELGLLDRSVADPSDALAARTRTKVIDELSRREQWTMWHMSHEARAVRDIHRMVYGLGWQPCNPKRDGGIEQIRHYLRTDYREPHPLTPGRMGLTRMFLLVDPAQLDHPKNDDGHKLVREQFSEWRRRPPQLTAKGFMDERPMKADDDAGNAAMMVFTHFRMHATPLTASESFEARIPVGSRYETLLANSPFEHGLLPEQELELIMARAAARRTTDGQVERFDEYGDPIR